MITLAIFCVEALILIAVCGSAIRKIVKPEENLTGWTRVPSAAAFMLLGFVVLHASTMPNFEWTLNLSTLYQQVQVDLVKLIWLWILAGMVSLFPVRSHLLPTLSKNEQAEIISVGPVAWGLASLLVVVDHALVQWILLSGLSWIVVWRVSQTTNLISPIRYRRVLFSLGIADLLAMLGLQNLWAGFGTLSIAELTSTAVTSSTTDLQQALMTIAGSWIGLSLIIRLGSFPFLTWNGVVRLDSRLVAPILCIPIGIAVFLSFQWQTILSAQPATRGLLTTMLVFSAVISAIAALFESGSLRGFLISCSLVSLVATGCVVGVEERLAWKFYAIAVLVIPSALLSSAPVFGSLRWGIAMLTGIVLMSGIAGAIPLWESLQQLTRGDIHEVPTMLPHLFLLAHMLCAYSLFSELLHTKDVLLKDEPISLAGQLVTGWNWGVLFVPMVLMLVNAPGLSSSIGGISLWTGSLLVVLCLSVGSRQLATQFEPIANGAIGRLFRNDLFSSNALQQRLEMPAFHFARRFDEVIELVCFTLPAKSFHMLSSDVRLMDDITSNAQDNPKTALQNPWTMALLLFLTLCLALFLSES